jgi:isocitrate dehydrogenase
MAIPQAAPTRRQNIETGGVDMFCYLPDGTGQAMADKLAPLNGTGGLELKVISNRGQKIWPDGFGETFCVDQFRCRFQAPDGKSAVSGAGVAALIAKAAEIGVDVTKMETLRTFNGEVGFSQIQGA